MSHSTDRPQSFDNHRAWPPLALLLAFCALLVETGHRVWVATHAPEFWNLWAVAVGLALLVVCAATRSRALVVQDRVITLEMLLRLERVLGAARGADVARLTRQQLIALRFAGDAELPALVDEVLAGRLAEPGAIKRRVQDWQADWLRV